MDLKNFSVFRILVLIFVVALIVYGVFNMDMVGNFVGWLVKLVRPFLIGVVIAFVLNVPLRFFERRVFNRIQNPRFKKMERGISVLLAIILVWLIIGLVISVVVPQLISSLSLFVSAVPSYFDYLTNFLSMFEKYSPAVAHFSEQLQNLSPSTLENYLNSQLNDRIAELTSVLGSAVMSTVSFVASLASSLVEVVVAFIFSIYILFNKETLAVQARKICFAFLSKRVAVYLVHAAQVSFAKFYHFIIGQLTEAVILGTLCTIGMLILRLPYAPMIGVLTGFCALIPIFGAFIGGAVGALLILTVSPIKALTFLIFLIVLQQLEGHIIYPKVVGGSVGLPAMWTLFAITVGGSLYGLVGMLLSVPLFAALYYLFTEIVYARLARNNISADDQLIQSGVDEGLRM
ncbi:MAG: AI-2E family transporter [Peptococcaceae bacterium]|nr:AI-2E family transporter [Peptococcaceae bacterium]